MEITESEIEAFIRLKYSYVIFLIGIVVENDK